MSTERDKHTLPPLDHIADLLPTYLAGSLDTPEATRVRAHLEDCHACREELAAWEAIREATQLSVAAEPPPAMALMEGVWAAIDAEVAATPTVPAMTSAMTTVARWWAPARAYGWHTWQVLRAQAKLVRQGIWVASAATMALGVLLGLLAGRPTFSSMMLALFVPAIAGVSVALVYGPESDPGLELALATPTSPRLVLLCRLALVLTYDLALAFVASVILVIAHGGSVWAAAPLWLGPMLLVAGISLLISLVVSAIVAVTSALSLFIIDLVTRSDAAGHLPSSISGPVASLWQTNPTMLFLAMALLLLAVLYVPRQHFAEG